MNVCLAVPAELVAVKVTTNVRPAIDDDGVPLSLAVPPVPAVNVTPVGNVPDRVIVGAGKPDAVTVKENACPAPAVAEAALVNCGACVTTWLTTSVNACVTAPAELVAVRVSG